MTGVAWCDRPQVLDATRCAGELRILATAIQSKHPDAATWMRKAAVILDAGPVPGFVTGEGDGPYWAVVVAAPSWEAACDLAGVPRCHNCGEPLGDVDPHLPDTSGPVHPDCCPCALPDQEGAA